MSDISYTRAPEWVKQIPGYEHDKCSTFATLSRLAYPEDREKNLVTATFELPGLSKENVQLDVKNNVLTVSGESTISSEHNERGYAVRERRFGKFSRSLPLPEGVKVC